jgi:hypothetical protein
MAAIFVVALSITPAFANTEGPSVEETVAFINDRLAACEVRIVSRDGDIRKEHSVLQNDIIFGPISVNNNLLIVKKTSSNCSKFYWGDEEIKSRCDGVWRNNDSEGYLVAAMLDQEVEVEPLSKYAESGYSNNAKSLLSIKCNIGECNCGNSNKCNKYDFRIHVCREEDAPKLKRAFEHLIKQLGGKKSLF